MASETSQQPLEIQIPARLQHVSAVRRLVSDTARQADLGQEEVSDLLLAVSEACNNAIQHGAREAPGAQIAIRTFIEPGAVHVEVCDPGAGFDPGELWEPGSEVGRGRGMLLITQLTDKVEYTADGRSTTVRLTKHRRGETPPADAAEVDGFPLGDAAGLAPGTFRPSRLYYLFDVCRAVSGTLELPEVLRIVAERTAQLFGVARARVLLHDPRRQTATVAASWGERVKVRPGAEKLPEPQQAVFMASRPAAPNESGVLPLEPVPRTVRSSISVPIVSRGQVVGSIHLDDMHHHRRFSRSDVLALRAIAAQTAVAIENARLYREVHRHVEELGALGDVARALNASLDLDHIFQTILRVTRDLLGVQICALMLVDEDGFLSVRASSGMSEAYVAHQRVLLQESPLARAISEKRVIATWDLRAYDVPRGLFEGIVSAAAAPMMLGDRPIGTLNIYTRERCQFSEDQFRVLRALAEHAALAIQNARLYEASQQARDQLEASLERTGAALEAAKELNEIIRLVAELAAQALGAEGGALVLTDIDIAVHTIDAPLEARASAVIRGLDELAHLCATRGRPMTLDDVQSLPGGSGLREAGITDCLAVPVVVTENLGGALCVYTRGSRSFGARDGGLLASFASQAAIAIENQRLLQDARLRLEELGTLLEVGQSIVSKLDLDSVLDQIIHHVSRIMDAQTCSILLLDRPAGELYVAASRGLDERHVRRLRVPPGEGVLGAVLRDGEPRCVTDIRRHSEFVYQDVSEGLGLRALLCVPLRTAEEVLGVLTVYRTTTHAWTDAEVKFLSALGTQAAIAIQNATLYQQERQVAQALQKAFVPARPPTVPGLEIGQVYIPAGDQGEVGGDYYDFIPVDRGRLGIVIADVSGKGLRAATGTAMGKYILRAYMMENPTPGDAVYRANNALRRMMQDDSSFLTLFYGLWDPRSSHLTYVNAGHPYPLLWQRETGLCSPLRSSQTMLLGILPSQTFTEQRLIIRPGDILLAYTDGVIEARHEGEQFGMARLEKVLRELVEEPAQRIADGIYEQVCSFRDDALADDLTLLVVKFQG